MMARASRIRAARSLAALLLVAAGPAPLAAPMAAQGCLGCHGPAGQGSGAVPPLAGRPASEIVVALREYQAGQRPATIMDRIARGYTEAEIAAAAAYFAAR
jgi:sulfide dehydrogenase cytochrome subunit